MTFFSISNPRPKLKPCKVSHDCFKANFKLTRSDTGRKVLVQDGKTNLFEDVQLFADECNIYNIIRRYNLGDYSVLSKCNGVYADTLGQPKTLQEALNLSLKLKTNFEALKPQVQKAFGSDFNTFLKSVADGSVVDVLKQFETVDNKEVSSDE